ncbi:MAG TPA: glycine cleavage T C-terminal barrel domain-containing protein [Solirubrobacterales bacterium]|nr:glycine cleavage T C-terminal barrel domain-containing protein [Solirubrobacterales bacterium]
MSETTVKVELDGQYRALRDLAGLVDRSERAKLVVTGSESVDYLQGQISNDVEAVAVGGGCYAALLDRKGHMRADLRVLRVADDEMWLDTEPIAGSAVQRHLEMYKIGRDVEIADEAADLAIVSVIGPAAAELTGAGPLTPEYAHREIAIEGARARVVATDVGIDLIIAATDAEPVRRALVEAGAVEVSEAAAEILRVESGRPRFGAEMSEATIPAEAGIDERAVSFTKGCYIGQETVARLHYKGKPNRHLRGLRLDAPASSGEAIGLGDREVGKVGTACVSPALGPIALAIVRREAEPGARVTVGGSGAEAEVVELPFS